MKTLSEFIKELQELEKEYGGDLEIRVLDEYATDKNPHPRVEFTMDHLGQDQHILIYPKWISNE